MKWCRNCKYWEQEANWQGNCPKHPTARPRWGQDADAEDCQDYQDKAAKYQKVAAKEA